MKNEGLIPVFSNMGYSPSTSQRPSILVSDNIFKLLSLLIYVTVTTISQLLIVYIHSMRKPSESILNIEKLVNRVAYPKGLGMSSRGKTEA